MDDNYNQTNNACWQLLYSMGEIKQCPLSQVSIPTRSMGQDPTTFEAWSGRNIGRPAALPNFGKVKKSATDVSDTSPGISAH